MFLFLQVSIQAPVYSLPPPCVHSSQGGHRKEYQPSGPLFLKLFFGAFLLNENLREI